MYLLALSWVSHPSPDEVKDLWAVTEIWRQIHNMGWTSWSPPGLSEWIINSLLVSDVTNPNMSVGSEFTSHHTESWRRVFYAAVCDLGWPLSCIGRLWDRTSAAAECLMEIRGNDCGREMPSFSLSHPALPILISLCNSWADLKQPLQKRGGEESLTCLHTG